MGIIAWIAFGLLAGIVVKLLSPTPAPGGIVATVVLGILGAVVGGFVGTQLGFGDISGFDLRSMALAIGGGVLLLFLYRIFTRGKA